MKKSKEQIKKERHNQQSLKSIQKLLNIITDNGKKPLVIIEKGGVISCND